VRVLERENESLHAELEGYAEQMEELQALREEAGKMEAQLGESEGALYQVGCLTLHAYRSRPFLRRY
jgi:cell shape-determining protein MreC